MADASTALKPREPQNGSRRVTVACNIPNGLVIRVHAPSTHMEPVLGGGVRDSQVAEEVGDRVTIHGYLRAHGDEREIRVLTRGLGRSGWALTPGVNRTFFEEWIKQNKDMPAVKNGLIKAHESTSYLEGFAKEHTKLKNGVEPIDPKNPPRVGRLKIQTFKKDDAADAE